jgi:integrase
MLFCQPTAASLKARQKTRQAKIFFRTPYYLRHGHAAGLIRTGAHPRVAQERLGHASAAFTMQVYGHVAAGLQQGAARAFAELMAKSLISK